MRIRIGLAGLLPLLSAMAGSAAGRVMSEVLLSAAIAGLSACLSHAGIAAFFARRGAFRPL